MDRSRPAGAHGWTTSWQHLNGSNWMAPLQADYWGGMWFDPTTNGWIFVDILYEIPWPDKNPQPWNNGSHGYDESPASQSRRTIITTTWIMVTMEGGSNQ